MQEMRRRECRRSLLAFCTEALRPLGLTPAAHHILLINELEAIARGDNDRLLVNMPPGSAKSTYASVLFPAWLLAQKSGLSLIGASHTADLSDAFSRRVMNTVRENSTALGYDLASEAVSGWSTTNGGFYKSAGVGGPITGRRADFVTIDDPVKSREDADSERYRERAWNWFSADLRTRLKPGGKIVLIMCMTGDTPVTMADGTYRRLDAIRPNDSVLAWDSGQVVERKVLNWTPQGLDDIIEIRTGSSRVRCNARHPFLTESGWKRAGDLTTSDRIATNYKVPGAHTKLTPLKAWFLGFMFGDGWVTVRDTVQKGRGRYVDISGNVRIYGENIYPRRGYVTCVALSKDEVCNERILGAFETIFGVRPATTKFGYARTDRTVIGKWLIDHGLTGKAKTKRLPDWLFSETEENRLEFLRGFNAADGAILSGGASKGRWVHCLCNEELSRDIRHLARGIGFRVTNIAVNHAMRQAPNSPNPSMSTTVQVAWSPERYEEPFVYQKVRSIQPAGREIVYDVQVDGAECFFADGLVSHNTRWHEDDLGGRIIQQQGDLWRVLKLPAIATDNDPMGRAPGEWLWGDDDYGYSSELKKVYAEYEANGAMRDWSALFQQEPRPGEGALFKTSQIGVLDAEPAGKNVVRAWDLAATEQVGTRDPDYTAGVKMMRTDEGRFVVLDVVRLRGGPDDVERAIVNTAAQDGIGVRVGLPQDPGQAGKQQVLYLTRKLAGYRVESSPESGDKATRAAPVASQVNVGNVSIVRAKWNASFLDELAGFPSAAKDDQVDALSRAFSMVGLNRPPIRISPDLLKRI